MTTREMSALCGLPCPVAPYPEPMTQYPHSSHRHGVILILGAALVISTQDVVIKLFSADMTLGQIFALRGMMVVPALVLYAMLRGIAVQTLRQAFGLWPMLRAACITTTFMAFYAALPFISLSTAGAANYSAPIFITLISAYVLGRPVSAYGWGAVLLGFAGVFVLLRPGSDAFSAWTLLPVMGACFYALAHIVTNAKCGTTPLLALALSQSFVMMLAGLGLSFALVLTHPTEMARATPYIFGAWSDMTPTLWLVLAGLSGISILIAVLLAGAYQAGPPVMIGTLEYSYLIFVVLWDIAVFNLIPDTFTLCGMAMIVAAGVLVMRTTSSPSQ